MKLKIAFSALNGFCEEPFWNETLTLDGTWPQFTDCFQDTVLTLVPCGFLWLAAPCYTWYLAQSPIRASRNTFSKIFVLKLLFIVLIAVLWISKLLNLLSYKSSDIHQFLKADTVSPFVQIVTLVLAFGFTVAERRKRFVTSGVLFIFWALQTLVAIIPFYTYLELKAYESDLFMFTTFQARVAFTVIQFLLQFFAEKPVVSVMTVKDPNPETEASFPSRLYFVWMNSLMVRSYRQILTEAAMFDLNPREKSSTVVPGFLATWNKAVTEARQRLKIKMRREKRNRLQSNSETSPLMLNADYEHRYMEEASVVPQMKKDPQRSHPSLIRILFKTFGMEYLLCQTWKFCYDILIICNPFLLGFLVDFVQDSSMQDWKGFAYAAILFFSITLQTLLFHQTMHFSTSLGLRLRASIVSAVFRKALTMDNIARRESTIGEVVNLMSVDADHIADTLKYLWALFSSPFQIIMCLFLLYNQIGTAMFAGAGFLVLMIPANGYFTVKLGKMEAKILALKDKRMKVMNELLSGIKIIKLYAWENSFERQVLRIRGKELSLMRKMAFLNAILLFCWTVAPFVVSLLTFLTFVYVSDKHYLDPKTAFVAIALFNIMRFAINFAPMIVTDSIKAVISAGRIGRFLFHEDLREDCITRSKNAAHPIVISDGMFTWSADDDGEPSLKNIDLTVEEDSLVAVVGSVGSGKSSLLSAMLGEIRKLSGQTIIRGSVSYVPQQAWIQNDTVRNNILFGKAYDEDLYKRCIEACALQPDLDILSAGDQTEIGERGINLSGGQKQRVSLARAVYAQANIYLLDDPLSAVDSHVGKHIFEKVISDSGLLAGKVRVLVTHGIHWLPHTDHIIVMTNGQVSESGHYEKLLSHKGPFAQFITQYLLQDDQEGEMSNDEEYQEVKQMFLRRLSETEDDGDLLSDTMLFPPTDLKRELSHKSMKEKSGEGKQKNDPAKETGDRSQSNLIEEESVEIGAVKWSVVKSYAKSVGFIFLIFLIISYAVYIGSDLASLVWLSKWTDDKDLSNFTILPAKSSDRMEENKYYISIYGVFGIIQTIAVIIFSVIESIRCVHASGLLHANMLSRILHAPMMFFDTTPVGRILNRFSKDLTEVDEELPITFLMWIDCVLVVLASFFIISINIPLFMVFIIPMAIMYFFIQRFFIATSRQLKRLQSKTKSPIFNHFSETLTGASVIRAFGVQKQFVSESEAKVDAFQTYAFAYFSCNRWLGVRLEFLGSIVILISSTIAVATRHSITGGLMGLVISYALDITENLNWMVRMTSELETQIVCVERIKQYSEIDMEAPWEIAVTKPPFSWPDAGHIRLEGLCLRYREGLDLVLKNLTLEIQSAEKVGIVGRTGAGKSSLTLALFRLVEPCSGHVFIDGVDVATLGLHDLRSRITILPQDPVIFAGSLRQNLDPFEEYCDEALWMALQHAHLKDFVDSLPDKLGHECGEGGENLSVGQRQLLCLGRALLRKTQVLILDEATAAVDMETDDLIQETIHEEFKECTILTIAHRLNTVMDYDRILVLDKGEVNDFDSPVNLIEKTDGLFYSMAKTAGVIS